MSFWVKWKDLENKFAIFVFDIERLSINDEYAIDYVSNVNNK